MGFVGDVLGKTSGIHIFYVIGLLIFITVFITILIRTIRMSKADAHAIKTDIFDPDEQDQ